MAANVLSKAEAEKKADKLSLASTLNDIAHTRAQQLHAQPYSSIVDNMAIGDAARKAQSRNAGDAIGMALQAYSAFDNLGSERDLQSLKGKASDYSSRGDQMDLNADNYALLGDKQTPIFEPRTADPSGGFQLQDDDYGLLTGRKPNPYGRFRL